MHHSLIYTQAHFLFRAREEEGKSLSTRLMHHSYIGFMAYNNLSLGVTLRVGWLVNY